MVYELKAVGEQTRDLLDTTSQVSSTLQHAHVLRRQRSGLLNATEKRWIDDVLQATEKAVGNVAALIEPARVDMQTHFNKIKFFTRGQFVLRDSPKVQVQLGRLGIVAQGLNTVMTVLCNREGSVKPPTEPLAPKRVDSASSDRDLKPPPSYELVELLNRRRESDLKRQASKLPLAPVDGDGDGDGDGDVNVDVDVDVKQELSGTKVLEEEPNSLPMVCVNVTEVEPTPVASPKFDHDRYAESDGLQVVDDYWGSHAAMSSTPHPRPTGPPIQPRSRTPISPQTDNHYPPASHSPSLRTLDSATSYIPYRPPGPSPPLPADHSWPSPPPQPQPPVYHYPPARPISASIPPYRPPDPPSPDPPYHTPINPQPTTYAPPPHHHHHHHNYYHSPRYQPPPPPNQPNPTPLHPLRAHPSHSSILTTEEPSSTSASPPPQLPPQLQPQTKTQTERQKGRARGRAWLEHQLQN